MTGKTRIEYFNVLGNSAGRPTKTRSTASVLLGVTGYDILIDCGENTYQNWKRAGYRWRRLKYIFISHLHPDHVSGLVPLLFYRDLEHITAPLTIIGDGSISEYIKTVSRFYNWAPKSPIHVLTLEAGQTIALENDLKLTVRLLDHAVPCYGCRFSDQENLSLAYITDTRPCAGSFSLMKHANVAIHEATFETDQSELAFKKHHTTTGQAIQSAGEHNVRRLVLTHFSPRIEDESLEKLSYNGNPVFTHGHTPINPVTPKSKEDQ